MAVFCVVLTSQDEAATMLAYHGPIAQLGERFNGIEEVKGSSPFRSIEAVFPKLHNPSRFAPRITVQWLIGVFCFHTAATDGLSVVQIDERAVLWQNKSRVHWTKSVSGSVIYSTRLTVC